MLITDTSMKKNQKNRPCTQPLADDLKPKPISVWQNRINSVAEANMTRIGERLKQFRLLLKLTQLDVAEELGTTQNMIYRAEANLRIAMDSYWVIVAHYEEHHQLNRSWLMEEDNRTLPLRRLPATTRHREKQLTNQRIAELTLTLVHRLLNEGLTNRPAVVAEGDGDSSGVL